MELFLAIAVAAVAIATLVLAISFRKRTEKQVSAMLDGRRDSAATKNEMAISELRAQLSDASARLDQLTVGLQAVQEIRWPMQAPGQPDHEAASPADNGSPDPGGDGRARASQRSAVLTALFGWGTRRIAIVRPRRAGGKGKNFPLRPACFSWPRCRVSGR